MAYQSLYRSYRPTTFDEVVGQTHIIKTLQNAIKRNQLAHAYLFCGPRGTGKTTIAKLFARGVNCANIINAPCNQCEMCNSLQQTNHPDIIEIDAASNNSVDDVRDLIERVKYAPIEAKYKVYIIDEVHMLSAGAFNALLKTLEEPPEHVIFILATTEIQKVIATIVSRCQRYDFSPVSIQNIQTRLSEVLKQEEIEYEPEVIEIISKLADGGMRDALTISEQVIAYSDLPLKVSDVYEVYKISTPQEKEEYIVSLLDRDLTKGLENLALLEEKSIDTKQFINDIIDLCKQTLIYSLDNNLNLIQPRYQESVKKLESRNQNNDLLDIINEFINLLNQTKTNGLYKEYLEISTIKLSQVFFNKVDEIQPEKKKMTPSSSKKTKQIDQLRIETSEIEGKDDQQLISPKPEEYEALLMKVMVIGDKDLRIKENDALQSLTKYKNILKYKRITRNLKQPLIGVSSDYYTIFITPTKEIADMLNTNENIELSKELFNKMLECNKNYFYVHKDLYEQAVQKFMMDYNQQKLPSRESIISEFSVEEKQEIKKEPQPIELIKELFGDFQIKE